MLKHRNSQKRIIFPDACYFVTCKTHNNFPYFRERIFCELFMGNLWICKQLKGFLLFGWVLAYDHFHLLVQPNDKWNISDVMFSIKKQISHNINVIMGQNKPFMSTPEGVQSIARLRGNWINEKYDHQTQIEILKTFNQKTNLTKNTQITIRFPNSNGKNHSTTITSEMKMISITTWNTLHTTPTNINYPTIGHTLTPIQNMMI